MEASHLSFSHIDLGGCHIPAIDGVGWEPTCICGTAGGRAPRLKNIAACCECRGRGLKSPAWPAGGEGLEERSQGSKTFQYQRPKTPGNGNLLKSGNLLQED